MKGLNGVTSRLEPRTDQQHVLRRWPNIETAYEAYAGSMLDQQLVETLKVMFLGFDQHCYL